MNLLEILKKIFSCAIPQAASEGDMDSISPSDKTNDTASADDAEVEDMDSVSPSDKTNDTASADNAEVEGIQSVVLKRSKAEGIEGYGQVRTMADILISMNDQYHFHSSEEAVAAVMKFIGSQSPCHFAISGKAFHFIADALYSSKAFVDRRLNKDAFLDNFTISQFEKNWDNAMYRYYYAKIWKLICYFDEFRRYTSPGQIYRDLKKTISPEYFGYRGYPQHFFRCAIEEAWEKIAPNNSIDPVLLDKYMFRNHEVAIQTLGLEATIRKDFVQDYCHTDVYYPEQIGSAPVYIEREIGNKRIFIKSCGEGKGPNNCPELLEFRYAYRLLVEDIKYNIYGNYPYKDFQPELFVPKDDMSLPIYSAKFPVGKLMFENENDKVAFLEKELKNKQLIKKLKEKSS